MAKRQHAGLSLSARRPAALPSGPQPAVQKSTRDSLCVYINKGWCTNCVVVNALCSEATEQLTVKCWPHYLPEFTAVLVIAVYIAPDANANNALKELHDNISSLQNKHPNILPRFYQHIDIPTRGNNTLDRVYTNIRDAYRAVPHPHLGLSDHISIMLVPAYHPPLRRSRPTQKTITVWPSDADAVLQDCFGCTDWHVFREAAESEGELDLEDYTSAVLGYISKCVEDVTTTKTVTCYPNQKPWLNGEVRSLLKARDAAFRSGDSQELRRARRELTAGVKRAKAAYALKIQGHLSSQDPRSMWRGIKCITDYKTRDAQCSKDPSLPEALNKFYARFEDPDTLPSIRLTPTPGEVPLSVTPAEVSDESGYRQEIEHLEGWCRKNNLCINVKKTKEMIVDFRRGRHAHLPLHVGGSAVEVVSSYRYLGVHLSNNLTWSNNTSSLVRKAHQWLYFHRRLRRAGLGSSLTSFYRCVVESVLCSSINVWHGSSSAADRKALQRVVKAAQRNNHDTSTDRNGKELLQLCQSLGLYIINKIVFGECSDIVALSSLIS
ncbi:hypothetical protein NFI96_004729 [Prochilodus magdalenae]|nr:hypothetical protein NFI96_004729 [Prochilodus magdalenae]